MIEERYQRTKYPLKKLRGITDVAQYGISALAVSEPIGVPMLRMNNLQNDGWDLSDLKYIDLGDDELEKYRIQKGDILFNRTNSKELVGKSEVFKEDGDWVFASYLIRVKLRQEKALPEFVTAFLNTPAGRLQIDGVSRQIIGMSNINAQELRDLVIPLPPLKTQETLVAKMETARQQRQEKLAEAQSLLDGVDGFVLEELSLIPEKVQSRKATGFAKRYSDIQKRFDVDYHKPYFHSLRLAIQNSVFDVLPVSKILAHPITSGFAAGRDKQTDDETIGVPHVRPFNITPKGEFSLETTKLVKKENVRESDWLTKGEVLFNNTNSTEWVGKTAVFDGERACVCSNHITRLLIDEYKANPSFIAALFNALRSIGLFGLLSTNFNNQAGINSKTLLGLHIPVPPLELQKKIANEVTSRRLKARQLRTEAENLWQAAKAEFEKALLG